MSLNIGSTAAKSVYVGGTQAKAVYLGATQIFPVGPTVPTTPIIWVGSTVGSGTSNTFATHLADDLLVAVAISSTNTARVPPSGYTTAYTSTEGYAALTIAYKWAMGAGTPFGTWPSGTAWTCSYVFRGVNRNTPFGQIASVQSNAGVSPEITLTDASGDSLLAYMYFNGATSGVWGSAPAGFISKNSNARLSNIQKIDSHTDGSATLTHTSTGTNTYRNAVFELLVPPATPPAEPEVLTEIRWKQIGPSQLEFTAYGGSGTYFWDFDGDTETGETNSYGEKVIVHTYKYSGWKTVTCMDMDGNANQQGVKVSVTDVLVKATWP
jgi:hypothetical protein